MRAVTLLLAVLLCIPGYAMALQEDPVVVQVERNAEQIDRLAERAADQDFILKLLAIVMPTFGVIVVAILQLKNNRQLTQVATAVDGMKTELVDSVREAALLQGAKNERIDPEIKA